MLEEMGSNFEKTLKSSFNLVGCKCENIRDIAVSDVENVLTNKNIGKAVNYLQLVNPGESEKLYIMDIIDTFKTHKGLPITNAFQLHELLERKLIQQSGINISQSTIPSVLHLKSVLFHTYYLYLKALNNGINTSYQEILSYDPLSCFIDKKGIQTIYEVEEVKLDTKNDVFKYFKQILSKEYGYSVFGESPLGNLEFYKNNGTKKAA